MIKIMTAFGLMILLTMLSLVTTAQTELDRQPPKMPELNRGGTRGGETPTPLDKLAPELRALYEQFSPTRGGARGADETGTGGYTSNQLNDLFGITGSNQNPVVTVAVKFDSKADLEALKKSGATIISQTDKTVYAMMAVRDLAGLANAAAVSSIGVFKAMQVPSPNKETEPPQLMSLERGGADPNAATKTPLANEFDKQGMTGKGVIVGVIDSGIDWQHQDFIRLDGTSRILAIWDMGDDSYQRTNGAVGTKPPVYFEKEKLWLGTVYTNEQINGALKNQVKVNSADRFGHGTAVAGTAAGNGRATGNGVPAGTYAGVAPDADLIIVRAMDCGYFNPNAELSSEWITQKAAELKKPVVINMSFGGQFSSHDGTTNGEQFIDWLTGAGKPGKIITVAAGNDARYSLHAAGTFGAKRAGQADTFGEPIELVVKEPAQILGVFNAQDDWGVVFRGSNPLFEGIDGKAVGVFIYKTRSGLDYRISGTPRNPEQIEAFFKEIHFQFAAKGEITDSVQFQMPAGNYIWWGFGGDNVKVGKFDFYSVESAYLNKAVFGLGTEKNQMIGSPGNAANAITVGSFDFRSNWETFSGEKVFYNLQLGGPSSYTSPGFRRDGVVKPDISAPAKFTISSLSQFSHPKNGGCQESMATGAEKTITRDGFHIAWDGTSAAAPYAAGVIALMLQKNPNLDAAQVRQILLKTARTGGQVGAVPNSVWGWGMIDPAAALRATPAIGVKRPPVKKPGGKK